VLSILLTVLYIIACIVLILFVLLQPGKSDAAAVFGGGANSSAFGPRGTATVLAKVTITAAIAFFLIAFLFSIPGLFEERSLGEGVGPAESAPAAPVTPVTPEPAPDATTEPGAAAQPGATPAAPTDQGASNAAPAQNNQAQPAKPAQPNGAAKPNANR
jgi:preprotein translocase subunit SecG